MDRLLQGSSLLRVLGLCVLLALASVAATSIVRALVPGLVRRGAKPWSCNVCMAFWTTAALSVGGALGGGLDVQSVALAGLSAVGLSALLLVRLNPPPIFEAKE